LNPTRLVIASAVLISSAGAVAAAAGVFYMASEYQLGGMGLGTGLFMAGLAWLGVRRFNRSSWIILGIAGTPTLIISAFGGLLQAGAPDLWSYMSMAAFGIFIAGMVVPVSVFRAIDVSNKLMP
jgi:hypothetical protein